MIHLFQGCNILVKAEYLNPGGSIKDRAALFLIKDALDKSNIYLNSQVFKHNTISIHCRID